MAAAKGEPSFFARYPIICVASMMSEICTYPIDCTKTRMQLTKNHAGVIAVAKTIFQTDGVTGFYRGLSPAIVRHWVYSGARIQLYEGLREALKKDDGSLTFARRAFSGAFAGGLGQFIASPTDMVKVRLVADRHSSSGPKYKGMIDCVRQVHGEQGVLGFWRGVWPNVNRAAAVNLGELATYDQAKHFVMAQTGFADGPAVHSMSAVISGFVSSFVSTPFDVMKTRMMSGAFSSQWQCLRSTIAQEGALKMFSGFLPGWARLGPWQFLFWITYERLRKEMGLGGF